jgi:hypothetical protein
MKNFTSPFCLVVLALIFSGCANRQSATVSPSVNLSSYKTMYVEHQPKDNRRLDSLIAVKLQQKGVTTAVGDASKSVPVDAVVTYVDRWRWDITNYLLELTIVITDAKTKFMVARGSSYHTSLTRLSPDEMVNEVIDNIYSPNPSNK